MKDFARLGKFLAMVLRHRPDRIGLKLDEHGWADVDAVLRGMNISMNDLEYIVTHNNKRRFAFNDDRSRIRARQGHSSALHVDLELTPTPPPKNLYHGTKERNLRNIIDLGQGLRPMSRDHVHLSDSVETAKSVADRRQGKSVLLLVDAEAMAEDGHRFYLSENGVWLTKTVPARYLCRIL